MPTICCKFLLRLVVSSLATCVVGISPVIGQTQTNGQTRPRSLATYEEPSTGGGDESNFIAGSPEARKEAKKLYKAGVDYGNGGFFPQAAELFRRALRLDPQYIDAHYSLGRAYSDMREWDKAIESFEQVVALAPKDKDAQKRLTHARLMLDTEKREPAETDRMQASMPTGVKANASANDMALTKLYRVGPGDVLDISVGPTDPAQFTVSSSGFLSYPKLTEPLQVRGLTVEEISTQLESATKGSSGFSVAIREYVSHANHGERSR
jgi:tetratricopeptide (TPR) repeat protein